ncbi:hypothetical protein KFZ58_15660 [Virgibacillus sp. NKC19-16]|uniref:hypothetical protein n=1 Tax=Virgibacillus salidurans TaxID=2831673 RepID=UPI001F45DE92|nr:hypothetical protein [Virgibacillus sp. NKC19-16]UJL45804.1 hypothetical protein KFZ58_15660 [Virgibacillus sp. NKC19-16]
MEILMNIKEINSDFFTVIAVLVGFNITSVSLISVFNKDTLRNVFSKLKGGKEKEKVLKQLISSFIYCVFIQIGIIVMGSFYNIIVEDLIKIEFLQGIYNVIKRLVILSLYALWIGIIFHSFIVSIRNVFLIYKFILAVYKE